MKRCLLLLTLLGCACYSFCQTNDSLGRLRDRYLRIGRRENKIGTILVSGGVVLIVTGVYISYRLPLNPAAENHVFYPNPGNITSLIGEISILVGIPVFIDAGTNKSKAMHLSFTRQKSSVLLRSNGINPVFQPALTLTMNFSKRKQGD